MKRKKLQTRRLFIITASLLSAAAIAGIWLVWLRDNGATETNNKTSGYSKADGGQPNEFPDTIVKTPEPTPDPNVPGGSTGSNASQNVGPAAPSGAFVSNHRPSLSVAGRNQIASACTTTEGATCVITFMKDGVTKTLDAKKADKNGSVTWDWTLQQLGLTAGSWRVTATATLNGQSKTADDPLGLDVAP